MNGYIKTFEDFRSKVTTDKSSFANNLAKFISNVEKTLSDLSPKGTLYTMNTLTAVVRFETTKDTWVINPDGSRKTASGNEPASTILEEFAKNDHLVLEAKSYVEHGSGFDKLPSYHWLMFKIDKKTLKVYPDENFFKGGEKMKNPESWKKAKFPDFDISSFRGEIVSAKYEI